MDVSGGNTTTTGGTVTFTTTDADNCFIVRAAGNEELISCRYDGGNENITLCNASENPTLTQLGSGQVTFGGNLDATGGLDVSGGNTTTTGGTVTLTTTDANNCFVVQAAGNEDLIAWSYSGWT